MTEPMNNVPDRQKGTILVIDDNPTNLKLLVDYLENSDYTVLIAQAGDSGLQRAQNVIPDLILLDVMMPEMDGFEVCRRLKADETTHDIPVIFLTALSGEPEIIRAFEVGAVDYVTKPVRQKELLARVNTHLTLVRQKRQIEQSRAQERKYFEKLIEMKNKFVRTASHDLKNPINVIMLTLYNFELHGASDSDLAAAYLKTIETQTDKMRTLVLDILDLASLESGHEERLQLGISSLSTLLQAAIDSHMALAKAKDIDIDLKLLEPNIRLVADVSRFDHLLSNLISNAIKYTPDGGQIHIQAQMEADDVIISIADTGIGIPEDAIPYLFDTFYRVNKDDPLGQEGTGLGLSIAQSIVEQHNGRIWVESELGIGSTFYVALPAVS